MDSNKNNVSTNMTAFSKMTEFSKQFYKNNRLLFDNLEKAGIEFVIAPANAEGANQSNTYNLNNGKGINSLDQLVEAAKNEQLILEFGGFVFKPVREKGIADKREAASDAKYLTTAFNTQYVAWAMLKESDNANRLSNYGVAAHQVTYKHGTTFFVQNLGRQRKNIRSDFDSNSDTTTNRDLSKKKMFEDAVGFLNDAIGKEGYFELKAIHDKVNTGTEKVDDGYQGMMEVEYKIETERYEITSTDSKLTQALEALNNSLNNLHAKEDAYFTHSDKLLRHQDNAVIAGGFFLAGIAIVALAIAAPHLITPLAAVGVLTAVIAGVVAFHQLDSREASVKSTGNVLMHTEQARNLVTDAINDVIMHNPDKGVKLDEATVESVKENMLKYTQSFQQRQQGNSQTIL